MNKGAESALHHRPSRFSKTAFLDGFMTLQILAEQSGSQDCPLGVFEDINSDSSRLAYGFLFLSPVACGTTSLLPLPGPSLSDGNAEEQNKASNSPQAPDFRVAVRNQRMRQLNSGQ